MVMVDGRAYRVTQLVTSNKDVYLRFLHRELSFDALQGLFWDDNDARLRHIKYGCGR